MGSRVLSASAHGRKAGVFMEMLASQKCDLFPSHLETSDLKLRPMSDAACELKISTSNESLSSEQLLSLLYHELRRLAGQKLAHEGPGQTLQATALVHEAYLRLMGTSKGQWSSRGHFFGAAAEAMRRILVERARHKRTVKAGGELVRQELPDIEAVDSGLTVDLLVLNDALEKFEKQDQRRAELVKLRFFAGLTNEQAAEALGISPSTADNDWAYARSWLRLEIDGSWPDKPS